VETASLVVHIIAGCVAVIAGYVALFAAKGANLHRRSGTIFVYAMLVMGVMASVVASYRGISNQIGAGLFVGYFVITAMTTVRPIDRRLDIAMLVVAFTLSGLSFAHAADILAQGRTSMNGVPVAMTLLFASVFLVAALSDLRWLRGALVGSRRIARHLWRMCFAFWIATGSFFLGQMDEFPVWLQKPALMAVPALLPLVLMVYWLWRVRIRGLLAGLHFAPPKPLFVAK